MATKKKTVKKTAKPAAKKAAKKAAKPAKKVERKAAPKKATKSPGKKSSGKAVEAHGPKALSADKQERLRKILLDHRNKIISEAKSEIAKFIKGESKQIVDTALDDGDWSLVDLSEDLNLRKLSTHKDTLNKIDEAIRKLREGTYGICEDCGAEISEARLKVIPFAIYCIDCKEKRERLEEFEREE